MFVFLLNYRRDNKDMSEIYKLLVTSNVIHFKFAIQCGFIGFLVLIIDSIVSYLNKTDNKSLLKIRYTKKNIFPISLSWIIGASIMGFLGSFLQLTANTTTAMGTIGISWPLLFSKMVESIGNKKLLSDGNDNDDEDDDINDSDDDI